MASFDGTLGINLPPKSTIEANPIDLSIQGVDLDFLRKLVDKALFVNITGSIGFLIGDYGIETAYSQLNLPTYIQLF